MLPKRNKLSSLEVQDVFKKGESVSSSFFTIIYLKKRTSVNFKASAVVSQKVAKSSVTRIFLKRRVYSIIDSYKEKIKSLHIVIVVKKNLSLSPFNDMRSHLLFLLDKLPK